MDSFHVLANKFLIDGATFESPEKHSGWMFYFSEGSKLQVAVLVSLILGVVLYVGLIEGLVSRRLHGRGSSKPLRFLFYWGDDDSADAISRAASLAFFIKHADIRMPHAKP